MASIVKRGKAYAVVYYEGEGKNKHQVWESGLSYNAAKSRKAQLEYEVSQNSKGPPKTGFSARKIRLLLAEKILPAADADHALSISGSKFPVVY